MKKKTAPLTKMRAPLLLIALGAATVSISWALLSSQTAFNLMGAVVDAQTASSSPAKVTVPLLDTADYDRRMLKLSGISLASSTATSTATSTIKRLWPAKTPYPLPGALLPFNRIVAYYGNLYSKQMGVLGQYPKAEMLSRLKAEVAKWEAADPDTPVIPALHYIAVTAQGSAGADGKYRFRMPDSEIDKVIAMAAEIHGIVFLDIQAAKSNAQTEVPLLDKYLKMPNVHLGIDPEFYMKMGGKPGEVVGSMDATDINYAIEHLTQLVDDNHLPPKILVIHRFTENMVTNYQNIKPTPEVQVVMDMDGWGSQARKLNTYREFVYKQPVQFTGFKLFYKNDFREKGSRILTPAEVLKINPKPIYIQYQ